MIQMRTIFWRILLLFCLALPLLTACGEKDLLIGTWKEPVSGFILTFDKNDNVTLSLYETEYKFTYSKADPSLILIKVSTDGTIPDITMQYTVTEDQLTLTVDGVPTIFDRVQ
jgi:major membrane immunogen (membrane-anchored lipoprotein)